MLASSVLNRPWNIVALVAALGISLASAEPSNPPLPPPTPTPIVQTVPAPVAATARITGMVTSRTDQRVLPGTRVIAFVEPKPSPTTAKPRRFETVADEKGHYVLEIPITRSRLCATMEALKPGFVSLSESRNYPGIRGSYPDQLALAPGAEVVQDVRLLGPSPYVAGVVVDDQEQPIPGAVIYLGIGVMRTDPVSKQSWGYGGGSASVTADSQGRFECFDVPPRPGTLGFVKFSLPDNVMLECCGNNDGMLSGEFWDYTPSAPINISTMTDEELAHLRIQLDPGNGRKPATPLAAGPEHPLAAGKVVDESGQPIAGARLYATDAGDTASAEHELARTDAAGRFVIMDQALAGSRLEQVPIQVRYWNLQPARFTLDRTPKAQANQDLTIRLPTGYTLSGRLINIHGKPLPQVRIDLASVPGVRRFHEGKPVYLNFGAQIFPDEDGSFTFASLPEGQVIVKLCDYALGPMQTKSYVMETDLKDQQIVFEEQPRPALANTITLFGVTYAEPTPELARYYGFPEATKGLVELGENNDPYVYVRCLKSFRVEPGRRMRIANIADFLRKLKPFLPSKPGAPVMLHLNNGDFLSDDDVNGGTTGSLNATDEKALLERMHMTIEPIGSRLEQRSNHRDVAASTSWRMP